MKCDSQASLLVRTFASPCLGYKPKARVAIGHVPWKNDLNFWNKQNTEGKSPRLHSTTLVLEIIFPIQQ